MVQMVNLRRDQFADYERKCAARIRSILHTHYPGHPWGVTVDLRAFRAIINHPLMPDNTAIVVLLQDEDVDGKCYVRLAGELLERFNVPRGGIDLAAGMVFTEDQQRDALSDIR